MAILSVDRLSSGRTGNVSQDGVRNYTAVYRVITDNKLDGPQVVRQATGIPRVLDGYSNGNGVDTGARVIDVRAELQGEKSLTVWKVIVEYSSDAGQKGQAQPNPLDRPTLKSYRTNQFSKLIDEDIDGNPIQNRAKIRYDEPIEIDDSRFSIVFTRNQANFDLGLAYDYRNASNSDAFFGAPPGKAKMRSISADESEENGVLFFRATYEVDFDLERGFRRRIRNTGYLRRQSDGPCAGEIVVVNDCNGKPITDAVDLNAAGTALLAAGADPIYDEWKVYRERPFAALGL